MPARLLPAVLLSLSMLSLLVLVSAKPAPAAEAPLEQALAALFQCTVVLKGSGTVLAAPDEVPVINPSGNARLATAGTGDVLAGMIGAQLAAGKSTFQAACDAVYQHGLLADKWPEDQPLTAGLLSRSLS